MIIEFFVLFIIISFLFITLGYSIQIDAFKIVGWAILFIISMVFMLGYVEVSTGSNIVANGTGYTITPTYTTYANHTIAFLMVIISIFGTVFIAFERKRAKDEQ